MIQGTKIGVWGFGIVGTSATQYLHAQGADLEVIDSRMLSADEQQFLAERNIPWHQHDMLIPFLERNTYIIPSPGIDLRAYSAYAHKWISELDLFQAAFGKPIIAITGSVGKTTVTHLLSQLLAQHMTVATGGNIGIGMLQLVQENADAALLELSSFQLELCKQFAPDIALWTNFHPNHLDRHTSQENYFDAKYAILAQQKKDQVALVWIELQEAVLEKNPRSTLCFVSVTPPTPENIARLRSHDSILYYTDTQAVLYRNGSVTSLVARTDIPPVSFADNWLCVIGVLHALNLPIAQTLRAFDATANLPEHRLELVTTINGVDFYNDSKSTTPASTLAAVAKLTGRPLHLFIGGVSKGVDRAPFIAQLRDKTYYVYCFGKEAEALKSLCDQHGIASSAYGTLEEAFAACTQKIRPQDIVLFSPAGASFDLFKNYIERGNRFRELILQTKAGSNRTMLVVSKDAEAEVGTEAH